MTRSFAFAFVFVFVLGIAAAAATAARAEVKVAPPVGDHMVVQQGQPVRLGGTAAPGEPVSATLAAGKAATKADAGGRWSLTLPAVVAGGPFVLVIQGAASTLTFADVWAGEVWVASGQSNMELQLVQSRGGRDAVAGGCPGLRLLTVAHATALAPPPAGEGARAEWQTCDAASAAAFSAVAFHFGREVHRALGVPVGLIQATWGGTPAEAWTPREALLAEPALKPMVDALDAATRDPAQREELARQLAAWEAKNFHQDTGNRGEKLGFARATRAGAAGWTKMELPQSWENAGLPIDGAVWFRREVLLPAEWAGTDLALSLGPIDDFDVTYWNGERVGATGAETPQYWSAPRRYTVPGRLAKVGRNVLAVRVFDHFGSGGLVGAPAQLGVRPAAAAAIAAAGGQGNDKAGGAATASATAALSLAGTWYYKVERRLKPAVAEFNSRPKGLGPDDSSSPTVLWNAMVAPLAGLPVAGVIWYQGESNVLRAYQYGTLFPVMVRAWRAAFGAPKLPFIFVQLPNYADPVAAAAAAPSPSPSPSPSQAQAPRLGESSWAELREAQALALGEPRAAMAVTLDIGTAGDIHPREKQEVGRRLALAALRTVYGKDVIASGPTFVAAAPDGAAMRVRFANVAGGLVTADGAPPKGFLVAGADRVWHRAAARIEGASVMVSSPDVPAPIAVRYGWADDPPNTLRSHADLPAAPFRSDDWPTTTVTAAGSAR